MTVVSTSFTIGLGKNKLVGSIPKEIANNTKLKYVGLGKFWLED